MSVHLVVDVEPPLLGELVSRALREPLAEVEVHVEAGTCPAANLVVAVVSGDAVVEADVVIRLHGAVAKLAGHTVGSLEVGSAEPEPVANLTDLMERVRRLLPCGC